MAKKLVMTGIISEVKGMQSYLSDAINKSRIKKGDVAFDVIIKTINSVKKIEDEIGKIQQFSNEGDLIIGKMRELIEQNVFGDKEKKEMKSLILDVFEHYNMI